MHEEQVPAYIPEYKIAEEQTSLQEQRMKKSSSICTEICEANSNKSNTICIFRASRIQFVTNGNAF